MKCCFVTVGTTKFEALIEALESDDVQAALVESGFGRVIVQYGQGERVPFAARAPRPGLVVESYRLKPAIRGDMETADLIVSHAGYGCLMESLTLGKATVAVTNSLLMDDHQTEIADALARGGHAAVCRPATLAQTLRSTDFSARVRLPPAQPDAYADFVRCLMSQ